MSYFIPFRWTLLPGKVAALVASALLFLLAGCDQAAPRPSTAAEWADHAQEAHNVETWWGKEVVVMNMTVNFGGNEIVDGNFTFQAHGPKAKYQTGEGTVVFDGEEAYVDAAGEFPMARFHVLTWPWFLIAPVKITGEGIDLSEFERRTVRGKEYVTFKQSFASGMGDTPDDWYRYFIDPGTGHVEALAYIVTYGKSKEKAEEQASIVFYQDLQDFGGVEFAKRYEFWYWDEATGELEGDSPKGVAVVNSVAYLAESDADFSIPEGATLEPLPGEG